jgi:hypothetical protein
MDLLGRHFGDTSLDSSAIFWPPHTSASVASSTDELMVWPWAHHSLRSYPRQPLTQPPNNPFVSCILCGYRISILDFCLQCNRLLRWCPSPDCNNAIKVQYVEARPVTCKCTHTFCFACGENWHDPVKCHLLRKWIKKCDDDSETSNWIAANTKVCKILIKLF